MLGCLRVKCREDCLSIQMFRDFGRLNRITPQRTPFVLNYIRNTFKKHAVKPSLSQN
jgi:hypothetical protein